MQARIGQLALELAIMWLCGEDMSRDTSNVARTEEWKKAKGEISWAMTEAQKIVGKRVKIGTIWVGTCLTKFFSAQSTLIRRSRFSKSDMIHWKDQ